MVAAARQCGVPYNPNYNDGEQDGVSFMEFNIKEGVRHSTAVAYLKDVADHPNHRRTAGRRKQPAGPPVSPVIFSAERTIGAPSPGLPACQTHLCRRSRPGLAVPDTQPIPFMVPMY